MDYIYSFIGALVGTWVIFNLFKIILFKFLDSKTLHYVSFIGSFILILVITSYTMGIVVGFVTYMPALFIWLVIDLIRLNKKKSQEKTSLN
ncbi:hypothetical protein J1P26_07480 [Neobacillus sp. MM2021_6]|uniref:hypothetical protein n=1 Tax=Bacillaceae TaxID=186817 RepID=UPI00140906AD|nr:MULTISPECIES: hypothetical protein [Bacillaceae]MBO0959574.1 hypothetical protein [Neobacillus sp. MM2021_6]NHC17128.1 hypothetical protein [Bacillus sp. MM2020_4]